MGRCDASALLLRTALLRLAVKPSHHGTPEHTMTHLM